MQGQEECKQLGVTLSVIKSAKENGFLLSLIEDNGDPWLGMEASNRYSEFKRPPMKWIAST